MPIAWVSDVERVERKPLSLQFVAFCLLSLAFALGAGIGRLLA